MMNPYFEHRNIIRQARTLSGLLFYIVLLFFSCERINAAEFGLASWYGEKFHGRKTSNGEIYDMNNLTCAHKKLPFGTILLVTNLENEKSVIVRVNDRGPFVRGRIIDLSKKAAGEIGLLKTGVGRVKIEIMGRNNGRADLSRIWLQVASFKEEPNAKRMQEKLKEAGLPSALESGGNGMIRVFVTDITPGEFSGVLNTLSSLGISNPIKIFR